MAGPGIITSTALGQSGRAGASNRLTLGCIGVGSQGTGNMRGFLGQPDVQVLAVCDVDKAHRDRAKQLVDGQYKNSDCQTYNDFRELLARDDIDMVSIALPDHWHAIPAIAAARAGKDIYAEKPLARTIAEGRAIINAVNHYGVIWQTGSWQKSVGHFRRACEVVRNGRIGKVHTVKVGLPTGRLINPQPEMPIPDGFDYDFWLGPAPWSPYTKQRCHWNFRWIMDYSGGQLTDWAGHHIDIAHWGMGTERSGPVEIEGAGEYPADGLWNAAVHYRFVCKYAQGFTMIVGDGQHYPNGARFEGTDGWVYVDRSGWRTYPENLKDSKIASNEIHLYESNDHIGNFLECVKSRRQTITPPEVAQRSISVGHLGNIAMQLGRKLKWDPENERFIGDAQADRMLKRSYRGSWKL